MHFVTSEENVKPAGQRHNCTDCAQVAPATVAQSASELHCHTNKLLCPKTKWFKY